MLVTELPAWLRVQQAAAYCGMDHGGMYHKMLRNLEIRQSPRTSRRWAITVLTLDLVGNQARGDVGEFGRQLGAQSAFALAEYRRSAQSSSSSTRSTVSMRSDSDSHASITNSPSNHYSCRNPAASPSRKLSAASPVSDDSRRYGMLPASFGTQFESRN